MRQRAVVGQNQNPGGILVQPAHRQHAAMQKRRGNQVHDRLRASVAGGGEHAGRFVKHVVLQCLVIYGLPCKGDLVPLPTLAAGSRTVVPLIRARPSLIARTA